MEILATILYLALYTAVMYLAVVGLKFKVRQWREKRARKNRGVNNAPVK